MSLFFTEKLGLWISKRSRRQRCEEQAIAFSLQTLFFVVNQGCATYSEVTAFAFPAFTIA